MSPLGPRTNRVPSSARATSSAGPSWTAVRSANELGWVAVAVADADGGASVASRPPRCFVTTTAMSAADNTPTLAAISQAGGCRRRVETTISSSSISSLDDFAGLTTISSPPASWAIPHCYPPPRSPAAQYLLRQSGDSPHLLMPLVATVCSAGPLDAKDRPTWLERSVASPDWDDASKGRPCAEPSLFVSADE